ncbi:MAG: PIN domain-containing protein [Nanoarchaeota archaeon]
MIKEAIFDSGVFIGSQEKRDQYALIAAEILKYFRNKVIIKVYTTDYVVVETINFLLKKSGFDKTKFMYDFLMNTNNMEIVYASNLSMERLKEIFNKYKNLTITDCSLIALAEKYKIKEIFSFDKHFDSIKGLRRLTAI